MMNEALVIEYVDLCEQIAAETLFAEEVERRFYDRIDQLWYAEMSDDDRQEAQDRLLAKARVWHDEQRMENP